MAQPFPQTPTLSAVLVKGNDAAGAGILNLGSLTTVPPLESQIAPAFNGPAISLPLTFFGQGNNVCTDGDYWLVFNNHLGQQLKIPAYFTTP